MKCRHHTYDPFGFKWSVIPFKHILHEMCPGEDMDFDVEELLYEMASDFTKMVLTGVAELAKNRKCGTLELDDFILYLKTFCDIQPICFTGNLYYINKHPCKNELATLPRPKRKYTRRSVLPVSVSLGIGQTTLFQNNSKKRRNKMQRQPKNKTKHSVQKVISTSSAGLSNSLLQCRKRRKVTLSSPPTISLASVVQQ